MCPSHYHLLARGPFPPTDHQLPWSCWRGLSVATSRIAAVVHTQLHGVLPTADNVHTNVSDVVSSLTNTVSLPEVQIKRGADVDFQAVWAHVSNREHQVSPRGASD